MKKAVIAMGILLASQAALADSTTYTIDPHHCFPIFSVSHLGLSTQRGRFDDTTGTVTLNMAKHSGSVDLTIKTQSLDMGFAEWNEHVGNGFFKNKEFPTITYHSDKLVFAGDKVVGADGTLTMLGVSKPLHVTVNNFKCTEHPMAHKPVCAGNITATIKRSDYGMMAYLPMIGDEVSIKVPVEAIQN